MSKCASRFRAASWIIKVLAEGLRLKLLLLVWSNCLKLGLKSDTVCVRQHVTANGWQLTQLCVGYHTAPACKHGNLQPVRKSLGRDEEGHDLEPSKCHIYQSNHAQ